MLTQWCAITVQLQPFMTHIPGLVASVHSRNARYHRNTEHTIAQSHLISPSRALNTLRLTLIATISDRAVRSSSADQRRFLASLITIRSLALQNDALARSGHPHRFIPSIGWKTLYHPLVFFIHSQLPQEAHLLHLSICNDRHFALRGRNCRPTVSSGLFRYTRGRLVAEEEEKEEVMKTTRRPADVIVTEVAFKLL